MCLRGAVAYLQVETDLVLAPGAPLTLTGILGRGVSEGGIRVVEPEMGRDEDAGEARFEAVLGEGGLEDEGIVQRGGRTTHQPPPRMWDSGESACSGRRPFGQVGVPTIRDRLGGRNRDRGLGYWSVPQLLVDQIVSVREFGLEHLDDSSTSHILRELSGTQP